jgi:hypothetical protein
LIIYCPSGKGTHPSGSLFPPSSCHHSQEWIANHFLDRPSSPGQPGCHGWGPSNISSGSLHPATPYGLRHLHPETFVIPHEMVIASPPRQGDFQLWCGLSDTPSPTSVKFRCWLLGFSQSRFSHIAQALQSHTLHIFWYAPLYRHAVVPSPFRVQVSRLPRSHLP